MLAPWLNPSLTNHTLRPRHYAEASTQESPGLPGGFLRDGEQTEEAAFAGSEETGITPQYLEQLLRTTRSYRPHSPSPTCSWPPPSPPPAREAVYAELAPSMPSRTHLPLAFDHDQSWRDGIGSASRSNTRPCASFCI